jgi:hypothetical protein
LAKARARASTSGDGLPEPFQKSLSDKLLRGGRGKV